MATANEASRTSDWRPTSAEVQADPLSIYAGLREHAPVPWADNPQGGFWSLMRYADIVQATRDTRIYVNTGGSRFPVPRPPLEADPPYHTQIRRALQPFFSPDRMAALEATSRGLVTELLEPLLEEGGGDFNGGFARRYPPQVLLSLLNQPTDHWAKIKTWCEDAYLQSSTEAADLDRFRVANDALWTYSHEVVADRHARPRSPESDLVSALLALRVDGQPISDDHVAGVVRLFIAAGHDSTTSAVGICVHHLARNSADQARLRADPGLIPVAIEEMLRLETPVQAMPRRVARDVELNGRGLKQGDRVMLNWQSANRDSSAFEAPDEARLDRKPNPHLAFGHGIHKCIGAPLARLEIRVALEEMLARTSEFRLAGPVTYEAWHRFGPRTLPVWLRSR